MKNNKDNNLEDVLVDNSFLRKIRVGAIMILSVAAILSLALLFYENSLPFKDKTYDLAKIGAWGDTVGGLLNPIFSFLALLGLLWTIRLQSNELTLSRKELELSREELKGSREANEKLASAADQQNIENAFFQLFNLLQENLQTIRVHTTSLTSEVRTDIGAKAFEAYYHKIWRTISDAVSERPIDEWQDVWEDDPLVGWSEILELYPDELTAKRETLVKSYKYIYAQNQADLGRYFRLLFNVLRFLSEKRAMLPGSMYETYFKIVRAALSNFELVLIMANCLTDEGSDMKEYVAEFKLFDNLPSNLLLANRRDEYRNRTSDVDFSALWVDFDESSFGDNLGKFRN